jgi:hypothetical protein
MAERLILYPVDYQLSDARIDAVAAAATAVGDSGFYVVETEAHSDELLGKAPPPLPHQPPPELIELMEGLPPEHARATWAAFNRRSNYDDAAAWWFSTDDLGAAKGPSSFGPSVETAFISAAGQWGVIVSHERHAVAGGSNTFVECLADHFPAAVDDGALIQPRDQIALFLRDVRQSWHEPMNWLPDHLAHV